MKARLFDKSDQADEDVLGMLRSTTTTLHKIIDIVHAKDKAHFKVLLKEIEGLSGLAEQTLQRARCLASSWCRMAGKGEEAEFGWTVVFHWDLQSRFLVIHSALRVSCLQGICSEQHCCPPPPQTSCPATKSSRANTEKHKGSSVLLLNLAATSPIMQTSLCFCFLVVFVGSTCLHWS